MCAWSGPIFLQTEMELLQYPPLKFQILSHFGPYGCITGAAPVRTAAHSGSDETILVLVANMSRIPPYSPQPIALQSLDWHPQGPSVSGYLIESLMGTDCFSSLGIGVAYHEIHFDALTKHMVDGVSAHPYPMTLMTLDWFLAGRTRCYQNSVLLLIGWQFLWGCLFCVI